MEKPWKKITGIKILKFLSKAQPSAITFQSPPPSPRKGSGPMTSIIPLEARGKTRNEITTAYKEPTSPKVSCMGKVSKKKGKSNSKTTFSLLTCVPKQGKKKPSRVSTKVPKVAVPNEGNNGDSHDGFVGNSPVRGVERVPSLGQVKKFASGRAALAEFNLILEVHEDQLGDLKQKVGAEKEENRS